MLNKHTRVSPQTTPPRARTRRLIPVAIGVALLGGLFFMLKRGRVRDALKNQYLIFTGVIGTMAGVLFGLFRVIQFLIRLFP
jgi:hypothetical protein